MSEIAGDLNNGFMIVRLLTQDTFHSTNFTVRPVKNDPYWDSVVLYDTVSRERVEGIVEYLKKKDSRMCYFEEGPKGGWKKITV